MYVCKHIQTSYTYPSYCVWVCDVILDVKSNGKIGSATICLDLCETAISNTAYLIFALVTISHVYYIFFIEIPSTKL